MQEHLSTSASQPASHASEFKAKREAQPHLNLKLNVIKCLRLVSHGSRAFVQAVDKIGFNARWLRSRSRCWTRQPFIVIE
jgi:hypothetical protein